MTKSVETTRSLILHPDLKLSDARGEPQHALAEAVSLASALNLDVVDAKVVPVSKPKAGTLFGSGKVDEIASFCKAEEIDLVLVDGPVSPIQQRNLEKAWNVKLLDRTGLILEIFGDRAATREGVLQVDLAQLTYQKSRLVRSWTHLERQRGALGFIGGPGETQIEADRRAIDDQIVRIRKQLAKVVKTRKLHRAARAKVPYPIVALVGYTNAGKSTIFNRMTGASVLAKDMLFATLDPTMRSIELPSGRKVILSDTVGFISDLPTQLVAAFRATLEEVLDADLILHIRDISHPQSDKQSADVLEILTELGISENAEEGMIEVWNKIDAVSAERGHTLELIASREPQKVAVSALTGSGIETLCEVIEDGLADVTHEDEVEIDYSDGHARAWLFERNVVTNEAQSETGYTLSVNWSDKQRNQFRQLQSRTA